MYWLGKHDHVIYGAGKLETSRKTNKDKMPSVRGTERLAYKKSSSQFWSQFLCVSWNSKNETFLRILPLIENFWVLIQAMVMKYRDLYVHNLHPPWLSRLYTDFLDVTVCGLWSAWPLVRDFSNNDVNFPHKITHEKKRMQPMIYWLVFCHMTKFRLFRYWRRRVIQVCLQVSKFVFLEVSNFAAP